MRRELLRCLLHRGQLREIRGGVVLRVEHTLDALTGIGRLHDGEGPRAVGGVGGPDVALRTICGVVSLRGHLDLVRDHEGGVDAHTKLPDDVARVLAGVLQEIQGPALRDDADVLNELIVRHTDVRVEQRTPPVCQNHGREMMQGCDRALKFLQLIRQVHRFCRGATSSPLELNLFDRGEELVANLALSENRSHTFWRCLRP